MSKYFAEQGLLANRRDSTLLNNLAFALINQNNIDRARTELAKIPQTPSSERDQMIAEATRGFLEYRAGNLQLGRKLYSNAVTVAEKVDNREKGAMLALAYAFRAMEEVSIALNEGEAEEIRSLMEEAIQTVRKAPPPLSILLEEKLTRIVRLVDGETCHSENT